MSGSASHIPLDELLAQQDWARSLARRLVRDPDAADDLVQETWIAALRRPPKHTGSPRGWIAGTLKNLARMRFRSASRRQRHEAAGSTSAGTASDPADLIATVEAHRLLAKQVLGLAEPYRRTLILRFFRGHTAKEIAALERIPSSTVRTREARALAQLRNALGRGTQDRWRRAIAPLLLVGPTAPAVATGSAGLLGVLAVKSRLLVVVGLLFLLGIGFVVLDTGDDAPDDPAQREAPMQAPPALVGHADAASAREASVDAERLPKDVERTDPTWALEVTGAWSARGTLLSGVDLEFQDADGKTVYGTVARPIRTWTAADDRVVMQPAWPVTLRPRGSGWLVAHVPGHPPWRSRHLAPPASGTRTVRVQFEVGRKVTGVVLQQDGRTPCAGCAVSATADYGAGRTRRLGTTKTDGDGRFTLSGLPDRAVDLHVAAPSRRQAVQGGPVELQVGVETRNVRVQLAPRRAVRFRLLDAADVFRNKAGNFEPGHDLAVQIRGEVLPDVADPDAPRVLRDLASLWGEGDTTEPVEIRPGDRLRVTARAPGWRAASAPIVTVTSGPVEETIDLRVVAAPETACRVDVEIRTVGGVPVPKAVPVTLSSGGRTYTTYFRVHDGKVSLRHVYPGPVGVVLYRDAAREPWYANAPWFEAIADVGEPLTPGETRIARVTLRPAAAVMLVGASESRGLVEGAPFAVERADTGKRVRLWFREADKRPSRLMSGVLSPGVYLVSDDDLGGTWRRRIELVAGKLTRVELPTHLVNRR